MRNPSSVHAVHAKRARCSVLYSNVSRTASEESSSSWGCSAAAGAAVSAAAASLVPRRPNPGPRMKNEASYPYAHAHARLLSRPPRLHPLDVQGHGTAS